MRRIPVVLLPVLLLLVAASPAAATTYCVGDPPGCTGDDVTAANFESTVLQGGQDGTADTAILDAETFTRSDADGFYANNGDPLTVIGTGTGTVLTSTAGNSGVTILDTQNGDPITFRNLTISVPVSFTSGGSAIRAFGDTFEDVDVETFNTGTDIADRFSGSTFRGGSALPADESSAFNGGFSEGIEPEDFLVEDSEIESVRPIVSGDPDAKATVRRSILHQFGNYEIVGARDGVAHVENSVIFTNSAAAPLLARSDGGSGALLTADHVTIIGEGGDSAARGWVLNGSPGDATVRVTNSIMRGYASAYELDAPESSPDGDAFAAISYSDFTLGAPEDNGDGGATLGPGNIDADPLFSDGDYRIGADSPALDAGDPADGGPAEDFDENPRPNDGNRDRTAIRDMGAFEFQAAPPDPLPTEEPPPAATLVVPPPAPPPVFPLADFGTATNVRFGKITVDRRGRVVLILRNANPFAVTGRVVVNSRGAIPRAAVRLGRKRFAIAANGRKRVRVTLSKRARRALRRRGRLAIRIAATVRSPAGSARVVRKRTTLRRRR